MLKVNGRRSRLLLDALISIAILVPGVPSSASDQHKPLSFDDRVKAQEAIERVYDAHRIWPSMNAGAKPAFEDAVSRSGLEARVKLALQETAALKEFWQVSITARQLQDELDRMIGSSQAPEMLKELLQALGNDPALAAECLARPALAHRLVREQYASDARFHGDVRAQAEALRGDLAPATFRSLGGDRYHPVHVRRVSEGEVAGLTAGEPDLVRLGAEEFRKTAAAFPAEGRISAVVEESDAFAILYTELKTETRLDGGVIVFPKKSFDAWWAEVSPTLPASIGKSLDIEYSLPVMDPDRAAPDAASTEAVVVAAVRTADRMFGTTVWTGSERIVWGGGNGVLFTVNTGARYNPALDVWTELPAEGNCPAARWRHTAVWTGREMIVWGGYTCVPPCLAVNTGGRYNPATNAWSATSVEEPCPAPSFGHTAAWNGTEMIVQGGVALDRHIQSTGGRYNPATDRWTSEKSTYDAVKMVCGSGGDYATLKAAFDAINAGTLTGAITLNVTCSTTETATAVLNYSGNGSASYTSALIQPSGGASRTISGAIPAGSALIQLNGADNVTINGLNSGGNALTLSNTSFSSTAGTSTIQFINGATNNTITNCTVLGSFTGDITANGGTIHFGTDAVTAEGNDNNTISYCNLGPADSMFRPTKAVSSLGTTTATSYNNSGNTITGNNIYDYFALMPLTSSGVYLYTGTTDWNITNNRFYQTGARSSDWQHSAIWINNTSGNNFLISGNTIGYASSAGTGTYIFSGNDDASFVPICLSVGSTTATSVQGNTITAITLSHISGCFPPCYDSPFIGIYVASGLTTIGDITGNTIGSQTATGAITFTSGTQGAATAWAIYKTGIGDCTVKNNTIGGFSLAQGWTGSTRFQGISLGGTSATFICQNNTVGGTVADSINTTSTGTETYVRGIYAGGAVNALTGNTVRNMTSASGSVTGITCGNTSGSYTAQQNTIYSLANTSTSSVVSVSGLSFNGSSTGPNLVARNQIHTLSVANSSSTVYGISVSGGTATYQNNMIALGNGLATGVQINGINETAGTNNFYFNSVYIGGTGVSGAAATYAFLSTLTGNTRNYRDNIFFNARSNGSGAGKHYAIQVGGTSANPAGLTSNNNILHASGTGGILGYFNGADQSTLSAWQTATGQDINSFASDPQFMDPTGSAAIDLHINPSVLTDVESSGAAIAGVTDDYDGDLRAGLTPTDIGADAGNFTGTDQAPPDIGYTPLGNTTSTSNRTLTATITDATGVPTSGIGLPVIYFRKGTSGSYSSTQCSHAGGSAYNCLIDYTLVTGGSVTVGDTIQYYVAAQDTAVPPHVTTNPFTGAAGFTANPPAAGTPPTPPNSYVIGAAFSGSYNVGAGQTYTSLTNAGGIFADINLGALAGNVTINITSNLTAETGTYALNQWAEDGVGGYTMTIKPSGAARVISGSLANGALIRLNGADRVTIDGSLSGGTDRSLTITNTIEGPPATAPTAVALMSFGTGAGAAYDTIQNCNISTSVFMGSEGGGWGIAVGGSTPGTTGADNDNLTIRNNAITTIGNGIFAGGAAEGVMDGLSITGNSVTINTADFFTGGSYGIQLSNATGAAVSGNTVSVINSYGSYAVAISLGTGYVSSTVSANKITAAMTSTDIGGYGRGITVSTGTATSNLTIANNVIYGVNGINYYLFTQSSMGIAIGLGSNATGGVNLYYNSVYMAGNYNGYGPCVTAALYTGTGASAIDLRNNILFNSLSKISDPSHIAKSYALYAAGTSSPFTTMDHNDYYVIVSGSTIGVLGHLNSDLTTLAAMQAAFGQNADSLADDPLFTSATDLVPLPGSPVLAAGTPIAGITTDINGMTRSSTNPTMGAYECSSLGPPGAPVITGITDLDTCAASGIQVFYTAGGGATSHNLLRNGSVAVTGYASGALYNPGGTTTYAYVVQAFNGSCSANSNSVNGTDATGVVTPTLSGPASNACPAATVTLSTEAGMSNYQWYRNGGPISGATSDIYMASQSGDYTVSYTNGSGCSGTSAPHAVTIEPCIVQVQYDGGFSPPSSLVQICGDGDGIVEPGEEWRVTVRLINTGNSPATNTTAALVVNAGSAVAATIFGNPGAYGTITANGGTASVNYRFLVDGGAACSNDLTFDITNIQSTEGTYPGQVPAFSVPVGFSSSQNEVGTQQTSPLNATNGIANSNLTPAFTVSNPPDTATLSYASNYGQKPASDAVLFGPDDFANLNNWNSTGGSLTTEAKCASSTPVPSNAYYMISQNANITLKNAVSTVGYTNIRVSFHAAVQTTGARIYLDWSPDGATWNNGVWSTNSLSWQCDQTVPLPAGAEGKPGFKIRFSNTGSTTTQRGKVDYVSIIGTASASGSWTSNARVSLVDPSYTVTVLKAYGAADGSPYNVKPYYTGPGTYQIRLEENLGGTATLTSGQMAVDKTIVQCDVSACTATEAPPPVSNTGAGAARFEKNPDGDMLQVAYDASTCTAEKAILLYGNLGTWTGYAGCADSDLGDTGQDGAVNVSGLSNVWFNIVWTNGTTAGHPGFATSGTRLWTVGTLCGMAEDDFSHSNCP